MFFIICPMWRAFCEIITQRNKKSYFGNVLLRDTVTSLKSILKICKKIQEMRIGQRKDARTELKMKRSHQYKPFNDVNTLWPGQNGRHFADDKFRCIFVNENVCISFENSLKFVAGGPINNTATLVWIMAWHRIGDKPLSKPMLARFNDAYIRN